MPTCQKCAYFHTTDNVVFNKYYCELFKRYVRKDDSCSSFVARPSGGRGCFLTSACVEYLGKADDCEELTVLRVFRDSYMRKTEEGKALVKEYYEVAPKIVEAIDASPDRDKYYKYINQVVNHCVTLIGEKKYEETQQEYVNMVQKLKHKLL